MLRICNTRGVLAVDDTGVGEGAVAPLDFWFN